VITPEDLPADAQRRLWMLNGVAVSSGLVGCAAVHTLLGQADTTWQASIEVSAKVNPDSHRRPSPVLIRLYELKAATAFIQADFVSLYQRDQAELGGDLLGREDYLLQPGERRPLQRKLRTETRFIGALAAYRDIEHARWRAVLPVPSSRSFQSTIRVAELSLTMGPAS
jgi:type VI secretion system protein VasD